MCQRDLFARLQPPQQNIVDIRRHVNSSHHGRPKFYRRCGYEHERRRKVHILHVIVEEFASATVLCSAGDSYSGATVTPMTNAPGVPAIEVAQEDVGSAVAGLRKPLERSPRLGQSIKARVRGHGHERVGVLLVQPSAFPGIRPMQSLSPPADHRAPQWNVPLLGEGMCVAVCSRHQPLGESRSTFGRATKARRQARAVQEKPRRRGRMVACRWRSDRARVPQLHQDVARPAGPDTY